MLISQCVEAGHVHQVIVLALEQDKLIKKEIEAGIIPDPATIDPETGQPLDSAAGMDLGQPQMEPEIDASAAEPIEMPKGGEI